ncbi:unnamed protein product [Trichogramma brassicae]|uniref:Uncharacterized protein n=1 Tax=Trichogramma brassicae TaxID=86971 RepID=A0A6H5IWT3_9HYME|nr:unnamed protein product [Trichogramma brassicae]
MSEIINSVYLMDKLDGLTNLERLKRLREEINWDLVDNRINFLCRLEPVISNWYVDLPNLGQVFQPGEIDDLLLDSVSHEGIRDNVGCRFIEFVARSGYHYDPGLDASELSTLCCSTPIHRFVGPRRYSSYIAIRSLFRIYNVFDVNLIDERGITHYYLACKYGCTEVVQQFLAHGHSPDEFYPSSCERPLHLALSNRRKEVVRLLLKVGANPNLANAKGLTPLQIICQRQCNDDLMEMFFETLDEIQGEVQIDAPNERRMTPLQSVVCNRFQKLAKLLLRNGAEPDVANCWGETPMHIICRDYDLEWLQMIFEMEAYNVKRKIVNVHAVDQSGQTPLHCALFYGRQMMSELLLNNGANPNIVDNKGLTALHMVCARPRDLEFVESFFRSCEDNQLPVFIDQQDELGNTPLLLALRSGNKWENIELLLNRGADPNLANAQRLTPLRLMIQNDCYNHETVIMLCRISEELNKPLQIDAQDEKGRTALHWALLQHNMGLAETLLRNGANPNLADAQGFTPLHIVCMRRRDFTLVDRFRRSPSILTPHSGNTWETIEILLRSGADPTVLNANGSTPLEIICMGRRHCREEYIRAMLQMLREAKEEHRRMALADAEYQLNCDLPLLQVLRYGLHWPMIQMLLIRGCDPNMPHERGMTLLHKICKNNDSELAKLFLSQSNDVKIDARDEKDRTPLHWALATGSETTTELLLRRGACPNLADAQGSTALHFACKRGFECNDSAKRLLELARDNRRRLKLDAKDTQGRTPLQWAVANVKPIAVDALLARGANLASFVFPTDDYFGTNLFRRNGEPGMRCKLRVAYGTLACVESLEEAGYELDRTDAMAIMKSFAKNGLLETEAADHEENCWLVDEEFVLEVKEAMVNSSLSLYDLISGPEEAAERATYLECYNLMKSRRIFSRLDDGACKEAAASRLCERALRGFFYNWALIPFWKLIHYRLPLEICELIVKTLSNEDLYNICLADVRQSDENNLHTSHITSDYSRAAPAELPKS